MAPALSTCHQPIDSAAKLFKHRRKEIKDRAGSYWESLLPKNWLFRDRASLERSTNRNSHTSDRRGSVYRAQISQMATDL